MPSIKNTPKLLPQGTALFMNLVTPVTDKYNNNQYTVAVKFPKGEGDNDAFKALVDELHVAEGGDIETSPVKDGDVYRPDYNTGYWFASFKANAEYKPRYVDQSGKRQIEGDEFSFGDVVRIKPSYNAYETGCSLYVNMVQMIKQNDSGNTMPPAEGWEEPDDQMPVANSGTGMTAADAIAAVKNRSEQQKG